MLQPTQSRRFGSSHRAFLSPLFVFALVFFWTFDEGSDIVAGDSSGNGNNGTLVNGPGWNAGGVG